MTYKLNVENCLKQFEEERADITQEISRIKKEITDAREKVCTYNQNRVALVQRLMQEQDLGFCDECRTVVPKSEITPITWKGQRSCGDVYSGKWTEETTEKANVCQVCFQKIVRQKEVRILPDTELKFDPQQVLRHIETDMNVVFPQGLEYPEFR